MYLVVLLISFWYVVVVCLELFCFAWFSYGNMSISLSNVELESLILSCLPLNVKMLPLDEIYKRYRKVMFDILVFS